MKYLMGIGIIITLIILFSAHREGESKSDFASIRIQVSGSPMGQALLVNVYKNTKSTIDSALIDVQGGVHFKRNEVFEQGAYTVILPGSSNFKLLLTRDQDFSITTHINDIVGSMEVKGSRENDLLYQDLQFQQQQYAEWRDFDPENQESLAVTQKREQLGKTRRAYLKKLFRKYPNTLFTKITKTEQTMLFLSEQLSEKDAENGPHFFRTHFWDEVDLSDPRLLKTEAIFNHLYTYMHDLTYPQTDSMRIAVDELMEKVKGHPLYFEFFTRWITNDFKPVHSAINDPEVLFIHMVNTYLTGEQAFWLDSLQIYAEQLRAEEKALGLVGSNANDISGEDQEGNTRSLLELKAPYVALYFYNPECEHCIEKTPRFVRFYEDNKRNGFEVFAMALGAEDSVWNAFIEENNMRWTNVKATEGTDVYSRYYVNGVPTLYLLNPNRTIIGKNLNLEDIIPIIQMDINNRERETKAMSD